MADEDKVNLWQKILKLSIDVLDPALDLFRHKENRDEFLRAMGVDPATVPATSDEEPDLSRIDAYINAAAGEADEQMLYGALADLTVATTSIEGLIRVLVDLDDMPAETAASEFPSLFFHFLTMTYVRRKSPRVYSLLFGLSAFNQFAIANGGYSTIGEVLGDLLRPLKPLNIFSAEDLGDFESLFETEESTANATFTWAVLYGVLMLAFEYFLKEADPHARLKLGYGYQGVGEGDAAFPVADEITDRFLTYSFTTYPHDDPDNQLTAYHTIGFVPEDQGGVATMMGLSGEADIVLPVSDKASFKVDLGGDGVFRLGGKSDEAPGPDNRAKLTFKHKPNKKDGFSLWPCDEPEVSLGLKEYSISSEAKLDDLKFGVKSKIPFTFKRKDGAKFPLCLMPKEIKEEIPLDFGFSTKNGFYFGDGNPGSTAAPADAPAGADEEEAKIYEKIAAGLLNLIDVRAALHKDIGGVFGLQHLYIKTGVTGNFEQTKLELSMDFWAKFGSPLQISVSRLGLELIFDKREEDGGFLGTDVSGRMKPPTGAGVVVNATAIKGGGYLYLDDAKGEYFGAVELVVCKKLELKAVGLINTKFPDDSRGFSLVVLMSVEGLNWPLLWGFTLNGLGGLIGYNRTIDSEAFRVGVRSNAIRSVFFPKDLVANINRVVTDLSEMFPPREDQFVIGLMARVKYGNTDLVTIDFGVIVELPDPKILIAGVVKVLAPDKDAAALQLQVNFLGLIDTCEEFFYFEADLYDSKIVGIKLTGTLAFVAGWGDNGIFAVSVGGFHPDFSDYPTVPTLPGAFRNMARVGFPLLDGDSPRLTIEGYLAVTSNSFQFGAKVELLAKGPMKFNLYGMVGLDAIVIIDPLSFAVTLQATLAIRRKTSILFGIDFKGTLTGTTPWHVAGKVSFGMLFFDVTIKFSHTWGDRIAAQTPPTVDVVGVARQELQQDGNWQAVVTPALNQTVTHRKLELLQDDHILVFPFGDLTFSQQALPLNFDIEKYGGGKPSSVTRIGVETVHVGSEKLDIDYEEGFFAAGNYKELSETEKLSRKSFEKFDNGFRVRGGSRLSTSEATLDPVNLDYELNYTDDDKPDSLFDGLFYQGFERMRASAAVANTDLSRVWREDGGLNKIKATQLSETGYAIASVIDLTEVANAKRAKTLSEANEVLAEIISTSPELEDEIQIVNDYELAV